MRRLAPAEASPTFDLPDPPDLSGILNTRGLWLGGWQRNRVDVARGARDLAVGIQDADLVSTLSAAAEHFACRALGVPFAFDWRAPGDRDFTLPDGRTGDVKWSPAYGRDLICSTTARSNCDVYVLVEGPQPDSFRIAGWATGREMRSQVVAFPQRDGRRVPTYVVRRADLRAIEDLRTLREDPRIG